MIKKTPWLAVMSMSVILATGTAAYAPHTHASGTSEAPSDHVILRTAIQNMQGTVPGTAAIAALKSKRTAFAQAS